MRVATRPTVCSFASTSHHFRAFWASAFVALWVVPLAMDEPAGIPKLETRLLEEGRALVKRGPRPRDGSGARGRRCTRSSRAPQVQPSRIPHGARSGGRASVACTGEARAGGGSYGDRSGGRARRR